MITRFMQVMFSAAENNDEELTQQVANDIEDAKSKETGDGVEDDEVSYVNLGSGKVLVIDKENGETTVAEQNEEDPEQYDLEAIENDEELEKYLHTIDGYTPDENVQTEVTEDIKDHMTGEDVISPNLEGGGLNPDIENIPTLDEKYACPECGQNPCECEDDEEEREYSVTMTEEELALFSDYCDALVENMNQASLKLYSDPDLYIRIFSDVLEEDKPAIIGDLKIEKEDDDTIIVTDIESGDEAQVTLNEDDEFVVNDVQRELSDDEEKTYSVNLSEDELDILCRLFSDNEEEEDENEDYEDDDVDSDDEDEVEDEDTEEDDNEEDNDEDDDEDEIENEDEFEPIFVVGIDPVNHVIVDSPVYSEEDAHELSQRLSEDGVEELQMFEDPDDARDYAMGLLGDAGVSDIEQIAEPKEHQFSDVTIYTTRYFSDVTEFMFKMFSEAEEEDTETQDKIEEAIGEGKQIEDEDEVITPIDDETAVVHDKENDEYTKVTLDGDEINTEKITEDEADDLTQDLEFDEKDDEDEEEEREYSTLERFFNEVEEEAMEAQGQPQPNAGVDPSQYNPETGDPMNVEPTAAPAQSVEMVEDKALAAVQSIQEAANEAVLAITEAKEAPAPGEEQDLREAQFSMIPYSEDTLDAWVENI